MREIRCANPSPLQGRHAEAGTSAQEASAETMLLLPGTLAAPGRPGWAAFAQSWEHLPRDTWMADGGTYRRRRYAAFEVAGGDCTRLPHRPHYQERSHNPLNGGVERWFAPMEDSEAASPLLRNLVLGTAAHIARQAPRTAGACPGPWMVEAHQFRIEALSGQPGLPTPEGMHCDGRDWVLVMLVGGANFSGGETRVEDRTGKPLLHRRLHAPTEALLLNDRTVRHGTSPIAPVNSNLPAWRDTLVLTFAAPRHQAAP